MYIYIGVASKFFGAPQAPIARGAGEEECDMSDMSDRRGMSCLLAARRGITPLPPEALEAQDHEPAGTKSRGLWTSLQVY